MKDKIKMNNGSQSSEEIRDQLIRVICKLHSEYFLEELKPLLEVTFQKLIRI